MRNLVVIPAFNEEESIPAVLQSLGNLPNGYEIVVVDDGSTDQTALVARREAKALGIPCNVLSLPFNCGIGVAIQTGYRFAATMENVEFVIQFDGDGQHDPAYLLDMVSTCRTLSADLCIGSRFLKRNGGDRSSQFRRLGIGLIRVAIKATTGWSVTDPTSGFRCAGPRAWRNFLRTYPDDYPEPESIVWCLRNGLRIVEMPVVMHERNGGTSSITPLRSGYYMVKTLLAIALDRFRLREVCDDC